MKYRSVKDFSTADWGKMAITGLLAGLIAPSVGGELFKALLDIVGFLGILSLCVWVYRKIKKM